MLFLTPYSSAKALKTTLVQPVVSVAPPGFCNRGEVRYGSVGSLVYEVSQKLTHLLQCIGNL